MPHKKGCNVLNTICFEACGPTGVGGMMEYTISICSQCGEVIEKKYIIKRI